MANTASRSSLPDSPPRCFPTRSPERQTHVTHRAARRVIIPPAPYPHSPLCTTSTRLSDCHMSSTFSTSPANAAATSAGAGAAASAASVAAPFAEAEKMNLGAILLGCVIQNLFYGNCFFLAWSYFSKGRTKDPWWFHSVIAVAWIMTSLSVAIAVHGLYFFVIESMFNTNGATPWTVDFFLFVNSIVANLARSLYVYRISLLCRSLTYFRWRALSAVALMLAVLLCLVELAGSIDISVTLYTSDSAHRGQTGVRLEPIFYLIFATGLSADAILTAMMCLWLHSARTGFKRTDSIINIMIVYTIETGLFPSLVETGGMIAFIVNSTSQIFLAFYLQIGVLYLTSLLTSLGARRKIQQRIQQPITLNFSALHASSCNGTQTTNAGSSEPSEPLDVIQPVSLAMHAESRYSGARLRVLEEELMEKGVTPDIERPQEQLERDMLNYTHMSTLTSR
ncbi:hypothetical protein PYCCODRAFT_1433231 [Trametes coccinea BRFM310]|uniref:DUF6534 domain-containing protein n=1 Tax=Trametes coccinea (strain BRFM310) TaxID=1353009 RepID=A0A1Y2IUW6_TRAC3|nr:hypothetical protein PYCCODRAFT_1433231 [Trametes coccinea BRFM310]